MLHVNYMLRIGHKTRLITMHTFSGIGFIKYAQSQTIGKTINLKVIEQENQRSLIDSLIIV